MRNTSPACGIKLVLEDAEVAIAVRLCQRWESTRGWSRVYQISCSEVCRLGYWLYKVWNEVDIEGDATGKAGGLIRGQPYMVRIYVLYIVVCIGYIYFTAEKSYLLYEKTVLARV